MATYKVKSLTPYEVDTHPIAFVQKYEGVDIPTGGGLEIILDCGTVIVISVSEWGSCYIKETENGDLQT